MATIKERREALGMSQSQFARALGMSVRTIQGWEAGRGATRVYMMRMVEEAITRLEAERAGQSPDPSAKPSPANSSTSGM
jgi:transcriptional regulator with XRE-family HTH domain